MTAVRNVLIWRSHSSVSGECFGGMASVSGVLRMRAVSRCLVAALLSVALVAPVAAQTPSAAPSTQAPKAKHPAAGKTFGDWGIHCEAQADGSEKCFASQYQFVTASGQRVVNVNFGYLGPKGEAMVVVYLPLGIDLQAGTSIKFEPGPQVALVVETCVPEGCRATAILNPAAQNAVRKSKEINVLMLPFGKDQLTALAISVKGLAQAFASLKKK